MKPDGVGRAMPTVHVALVEGHDEARIQTFMAKVTDLCVETLGSPREGVIVVVDVVPAQHYMRGGVTIAERRRAP